MNLNYKNENSNRGELYDVEVSQEGMQELNPLVPRASSISLKLSRQSNSRNQSEMLGRGDRKGKKKKAPHQELSIQKQGSSFDLRMEEQDGDSLVIKDVPSYYNKHRAIPSQKPQATNTSYSRNPTKGQGLTIEGDSFGSLRQISQMTQQN